MTLLGYSDGAVGLQKMLLGYSEGHRQMMRWATVRTPTDGLLGLHRGTLTDSLAGLL